jgi:hypothetical protein
MLTYGKENMGQKIELGRAHNVGTGIISEPKTLDEQIKLLKERVETLTKAFNAVNSTIIKEGRNQDTSINKDGIPIDTSLIGESMRGGIHVLSVKPDKYYIGISGYESLSAAAEAASRVRRSGWTFWKMPNGKTVKEVYGKTHG